MHPSVFQDQFGRFVGPSDSYHRFGVHCLLIGGFTVFLAIDLIKVDHFALFSSFFFGSMFANRYIV